MRLATSAFLLLEKLLHKSGCRLHDTQLRDTARLIGETNLNRISFPQFYMLRLLKAWPPPSLSSSSLIATSVKAS